VISSFVIQDLVTEPKPNRSATQNPFIWFVFASNRVQGITVIPRYRSVKISSPKAKPTSRVHRQSWWHGDCLNSGLEKTGLIAHLKCQSHSRIKLFSSSPAAIHAWQGTSKNQINFEVARRFGSESSIKMFWGTTASHACRAWGVGKFCDQDGRRPAEEKAVLKPTSLS